MWLVHPYVTTILYIHGKERMPFQGRLLMALIMRWASEFWLATKSAELLSRLVFWFPHTVHADVVAQAIINLACLIIAGVVAIRLYRAASKTRLLEPLVYPLVLVLVVATYMLHTIQNFRFVYDLPSLALFSLAMEALYFHRSRWWFATLFVIATANRETSLLMLAFYVLSQIDKHGRIEWRRQWKPENLMLLFSLGGYWIGWQLAIHHAFSENVSEFYPRIPLNLTFLVTPNSWPQLFSTYAYLLPFVVLYRKKIRDLRLRAWLWALPIWFAFMFVYGILVETRIFGEMISFIACVALLIGEELLVQRMQAVSDETTENGEVSEAIAAD